MPAKSHVLYREQEIVKLNLAGAGYSEEHGK